MVEGSGADNLTDGVRDRDGKFVLNLGAGKKDTLVGKKLGNICNVRGGAGVKKDVISQDGMEIVLKFDADVGADAHDQHVWFFLGKGHGRPPGCW